MNPATKTNLSLKSRFFRGGHLLRSPICSLDLQYIIIIFLWWSWRVWPASNNLDSTIADLLVFSDRKIQMKDPRFLGHVDRKSLGALNTQLTTNPSSDDQFRFWEFQCLAILCSKAEILWVNTKEFLESLKNTTLHFRILTHQLTRRNKSALIMKFHSNANAPKNYLT